MFEDTAFVLVTDELYFKKAEQTIKDLRTYGKWYGVINLITIGFDLSLEFKEQYNVDELKFKQIDKSHLLSLIDKNGFTDGDKREIHKLNQWEKLHVFDKYFQRWSRIVFMDAGLRVLDTVIHLLKLDYKGSILAPNDAAPYYKPDKIFSTQVTNDKTNFIHVVKRDFGEKIMEQQYFLNCIWVYDTSILDVCDKSQLIDGMNKYPICKTNEMTIMNLYFHFKYKLWREFPIKTTTGKYLFEWCETNHPFHTTWQNYCYIKYPVTIGFDV